MSNIINNKGAFWCHKHNCQYTGYNLDMYCGKCVMEQEAAAARAAAVQLDKMSGFGENFGTDLMFNPASGTVGKIKGYSHRFTVIKFGGTTIHGNPKSGGHLSYYVDTHKGPAEVQLPLNILDPYDRAVQLDAGDVLYFDEDWARTSGNYPIYRAKAYMVSRRNPIHNHP